MHGGWYKVKVRQIVCRQQIIHLNKAKKNPPRKDSPVDEAENKFRLNWTSRSDDLLPRICIGADIVQYYRVPPRSSMWWCAIKTTVQLITAFFVGKKLSWTRKRSKMQDHITPDLVKIDHCRVRRADWIQEAVARLSRHSSAAACIRRYICCQMP
jgi:hypothetical protein